jgi:hypothetical protein
MQTDEQVGFKWPSPSEYLNKYKDFCSGKITKQEWESFSRDILPKYSEKVYNDAVRVRKQMQNTIEFAK